MANLDYNIASGIRPIQLESPQNQLMQAYQLKGAQEASQMNALKMQDIQQERAATNALNAAYQAAYDPATGQLDANKLRQSMASGGFGARIPSIEKSLAEARKEQLGQQKAGAEVANLHFAQAHDYLSTLDPKNPNTLTAFKQLTVKLFDNPSTGDVLRSQGADVTTALKNIDLAAANGTLGEAINRGALTAQQFALTNPARIKAEAEQFSQQYSEYVDTMARMGKQPVSQAEFRQYISQRPATAAQQPPPPVGAQPVVRPGEGVALMSGENMTAPPPVAAAPVADGVTTTAVAAPQVEMVQTPSGPMPVSNRGAMPGMNATAAALYATGRAEDKQKADAIIAAEKEKNRPEALSPLGKLRQERAAAADKGDMAAVREYDKAIKKEINTAAQLAPVVPSAPSLSQNAIDDQANRFIIDGTLPALGMGKDAVANRNAIINRASELARAGGMSNDRITQMQNKANSAALSQLTKQETMVGAFEKNFVKNADLVLKFSSKVDRAGAPLLDKWIQSGKRAATGDPELKALDVAIKAVSNEYAKIVSGSMGNTAVAVSEIKRMESLLNSAMTKQDVLSVINVMKTETENRMAGFKEQKAELTNSMRGGVSAPPVGGVLKPEVKILLDKYK
jgi:hypothetical protein